MEGDGAGWPPYPPAGTIGFEAPKLPIASPVGDIVCPIGQAMDPHLTTPAWAPADQTFPPFAGALGVGGSTATQGGLNQIDTWAWEMGSEAPSAWSKATSNRTGQSGVSRLSSSTGTDGLIPGLVDGQRLSAVKPSSVPSCGGKVVVCLRKEVPQGYWDTLSVVLVNLPESVTLKPTGIKKGKKLCVEVPAGLKPNDYDVRLKVGEKIIHGSIPLSIRDDEDQDEMDDDDDDLTELAGSFRSLAK